MASNVTIVDPKWGNSVFQFKISLKYPKPTIWRRVLVPGDYTFRELHLVIQHVMGWSNTHLHKFDIIDPLTGEEIEVSREDFASECGEKWVYEKCTRLYTYFKNKNQKAAYDYDFGSTWHHIILLEKILPADRTKTYPQCIAGKRATPPEDVSPDDLEEEFDPEFFDAKLITFDAKIPYITKCRDFLKEDEKVQLHNLSSDEYESDSSDYLYYYNYQPQTQKRKRKVPDDEVSKSIPAKFTAPENKGLEKNCNSVLEMTEVIDSESDPSHSKNHAEDINVPSVSEDEFCKNIASRVMAIKDLKKREELQIEIERILNKYVQVSELKDKHSI